MQGIVLEIDFKSDSGLIRGNDDIRYEFKTETCRNGVPLVGSTVDFEIQDKKASAIYTLKTPLRAKLDWLFWFLFSFRGRISRDQLVGFFTVCLFVLPFPASAAVWSGLGASFFTAGWLLALYVFSAVIVKRFHDSGSSAFWLIFTLALSVFVTLIVTRVLNLAFIGTAVVYVLIAFLTLAVIFCLYLCFVKGSMGKNRYGDEPYFCRTVRLK